MIVFIAGPRAITRLNKKVINKLDSIYDKQFDVVLGDANGIDKAVQDYFFNKSYDKITIYSTGMPRNNKGNWKVKNIEVKSNKKDFDYYAAKDIEMAEDADCGLMIWNGKSKGTLHNTLNLISRGKETVLFYTPEQKFYTIQTSDDLTELIGKCEEETKKLYEELNMKVKLNSTKQMVFNICS